MLFRLTRDKVEDTGPWWAYPAVGAILTAMAVALACFRFVGTGVPFELFVRSAGGGVFSAATETPRLAATAETPTGSTALVIGFDAPYARGQDLLVTVRGPVKTLLLNDAGPTPGKLAGTYVFAGKEVKEANNKLYLDPAGGILEVQIRDHVLRSDRTPRFVVLQGGPATPAEQPPGYAIAIAGAFGAIVVFALLAFAPGKALAATGGLFLLGAIVASIANVVGGTRLHVGLGGLAAVGAFPLAFVSLGTVLHERPALRTYLEVLTVYLLGIPFHGMGRPAHGAQEPLAAFIDAVWRRLTVEGVVQPAAVETVAAVLAAMIAAAGALAMHRAALQLVEPPAANLALILYAFGTSILSSTTMDLGGQGVAALGVALALLCFARCGEGAHFDALAGAALGLAAAARLPAGLALAAGGLGVLFSRPKRALPFALGAAPLLLGLLVYQDRAFGAMTATRFGPVPDALRSLGVPQVEALAGLLLSPNRGLFIFTPALLLFFLGLPRLFQRAEGGTIALATLFPLGLILLIAARGEGWSGGLSHGPRILTEALPPLVLLVALGVDLYLTAPPARGAAWALVAISIALHGLQFICPSDEWNRRYEKDLDAAAWRAPELALKVHLEELAHFMRIK